MQIAVFLLLLAMVTSCGLTDHYFKTHSSRVVGRVADKVRLLGTEHVTTIRKQITQIITNENPFKPLTDKSIAEQLREESSFNLSTYAVRKHRVELAIPSSKKRRTTEILNRIEQWISNEDPLRPLTDKIITDQIREEFSLDLSTYAVRNYRIELGIPTPAKRRVNGISNQIKQMIGNEGLSQPVTDREIVAQLKTSVNLSNERVRQYREILGIPSSKKRKSFPKSEILNRMEHLIQNEDSMLPLTDKEVVNQLREEFSINLSEATFYKYRKKLNIPSSIKRRKDKALTPIKHLIQNEDPIQPLTDKMIADQLREEYFVNLSVNTVQNYRIELGIPSYEKRKIDGLLNRVKHLIKGKGPVNPLTDKEIVDQLKEEFSVDLSEDTIYMYRKKLGVPHSTKHSNRKAEILNQIKQWITNEDPLQPLTDKSIADQLREEFSVNLSDSTIHRYRMRLGIPSSKKRKKKLNVK